ncbi:MAG: YdjY domain-containing protein [Pseudomonadota bacterium]
MKKSARLLLAAAACLTLLLLAALAQALPQELMGLSPDKPLIVDQQNHSLRYLAKVNGKYLHQPTRHASIWEGGKFGDKSVFTAFVKPDDFRLALLSLGLKPGENMTMDNKETTSVRGDELAVGVTWAGAAKTYSLDEVIVDSNKKPIVIRFGGNKDNSLKLNTGCLICLDSCPVGIASNATYTYGAVEKRGEVGFTGNAQLLPPDGTLVVISVGPRK